MEFKDVINKHKLERHDDVLSHESGQYILKFEGYAYVLYKKIQIRTNSWGEVFQEPLAHFRDPHRLDIFLEILFDKFETAD